MILDHQIEIGHDTGIQPLIKNNRGRAKGAIAVLWVMFGLGCIFVLFSIAHFALWWDAFDAPVDSLDLRIHALVALLLTGLYYIGYIVTAVFFIMWFRRAYYNIHKLDNTYLSCDEGWAAGTWFVPFLNFVRPYTIMREICEHTSEHAGKINGRHNIASKLVASAGWWWALWLASFIMLRVANYMSKETAVIKLLLIATALMMLSFILEMTAALIMIRMIRKVSAAEQELYEDAKLKVRQEANASYYAPQMN